MTSLLHAQKLPVARHVSSAKLDRNTRELFRDSMYWDNYFYDSSAKLVRSPNGGMHGRSAGHYMVRESSWYALGLLLRDQQGDRERAAEILDTVLKEQYTTPGVRWHGTYKRTPEEPDPTEKSIIWRGYDPNWRHFIGTTFAMILIEFPERVSPELRDRMYKAIDLAIEGEMHEGRLAPSYTNIALMYGFLWDFAAVHDHNADWLKQSAAWNDEVFRLYKQFDAFYEYNSPTYCGVDIYGLALFRDYGSSAHMREIGSEMEAGLWRDLMKYYNPDLRNLSGPYDRSYGMDMESYVSVVGLWMRTLLDATHAPFPYLSAATDHLPDLWFAPHAAILGTSAPADAIAKMKHFDGEHLVRQQIDARRTATAWIGKDVMFGGESTQKTKDAGTTTQFHPATIQWRTPSGSIGWVQLVQCPPVDATADEHGLTIDTSGTVRLRIHAVGIDKAKVSGTSWDLPGLHVTAENDAKGFTLDAGQDSVDLVYNGMNHMHLAIERVR
ncbi:MAG TPA: hypothetical protein VFW30_08785 [Bryocella sp.]|nr:hypothetical protein [Bryocella sp.]